jgi:peptide chain release factor 1
VEWYSGSGAGGQHRNKHQNSARLRHLPTGIIVTAQCRKRAESLNRATTEITERLDSLLRDHGDGSRNDVRTGQIGTGMRADKRRTYRFRDDRVVDHLSGKICTCKKIMSGRFDLMW